MSPTDDPDELTHKDIMRWYHKHGMPVEKEDWGPRDETGESIGQQTQEPERYWEDKKRKRVNPHDPAKDWWWEKAGLPWKARTPEDAEWVAILDAFFAPYLSLLPREKSNLIWHAYNSMSSFTSAAEEEGISRQAAQQGTVRALQDLTRLIAEDDPLFHPPRDGRARDHEEEARAARRVLMVYLERGRKHE